MKKLLAVVLSLFIFLTLAGCDGGSKSNVTSEDVMNAVIEKIQGILREQGIEDEAFDEEVLPYYSIIDFTNKDEMDFFPYDGVIDLDKIEGGFSVMHMMMVNADRIIVMQASDPSYLPTIKAALEQERKAQLELWENYIPNQFEKVKNTIIETHGNFIFYITFENAEDIETVILNIIK